jgi:hypothetical protein
MGGLGSAPEGGGRVALADLAHGHADVGAGAFRVHLAGIGQRLDGGLVHLGGGGEEFVNWGVHIGVSWVVLRRSPRWLVPHAAPGQDGVRLTQG